MTEKSEKPFYKKWWAWLVFAIVIMFGVPVACTSCIVGCAVVQEMNLSPEERAERNAEREAGRIAEEIAYTEQEMERETQELECDEVIVYGECVVATQEPMPTPIPVPTLTPAPTPEPVEATALD